MNKIWNVAIYARISTDKESQSESIGVQVENLKKWILEKSRSKCDVVYNLVDVYEDQGQSGSTFERMSFTRMKQDIEENKYDSYKRFI